MKHNNTKKILLVALFLLAFAALLTVTVGAKAKIGETEYDTLEEAIAAAQSGDTVTLTDDVTMAGSAAVAVTKDLTIDGDSHKITGGNASGTYLFEVNGAKLTVVDAELASVNGFLLHTTKNSGAVVDLGAGANVHGHGTDNVFIEEGNTLYIRADATVTLDAGTVSASSRAIACNGIAHVYGTISAKASGSVWCMGLMVIGNNATAHIYVYDGALVENTSGNTGSNSAALWINCATDITGGIIRSTSDYAALALRAQITCNISGNTQIINNFTGSGISRAIQINVLTQLNIKGNAKVIATGTSGYGIRGDNTNSFTYTVTIADNVEINAPYRAIEFISGKPTLNVTGGLIVSKYGILTFPDKTPTSTINISGGTIKTISGGSCVFINSGAGVTTVNMTGGTMTEETGALGNGFNIKTGSASVIIVSGGQILTCNRGFSMENVKSADIHITGTAYIGTQGKAGDTAYGYGINTYQTKCTITIDGNAKINAPNQAIRLSGNIEDGTPVKLYIKGNAVLSSESMNGVTPSTAFGTIYVAGDKFASEVEISENAVISSDTAMKPAIRLNPYADYVSKLTVKGSAQIRHSTGAENVSAAIYIGDNANRSEVLVTENARVIAKYIAIESEVASSVITVEGNAYVSSGTQTIRLSRGTPHLTVRGNAQVVLDGTAAGYAIYLANNAAFSPVVDICGSAKITCKNTATATVVKHKALGTAAQGTPKITVSGTPTFHTPGLCFYFLTNGSPELTITGGTFTSTDDSLFYSTTKDPFTVRATGGTFRGLKGFILPNTTKGATIDLSGDVDMLVSGEAVSFCADSTSTLTVRGGRYVSETADAVIQSYGSDNAEGAPQSEHPVTTIYGGYFEARNLGVVRAVTGGILNIYGGYFYFDPPLNTNGGNVVRAGTGISNNATVNVYGGQFVSTGASGAIFNVISAGCTLNVYSYSCLGGRGVLETAGTGTIFYEGGCNHAAGGTFLPQRGAQVRFTKGSTGLRFVSGLDAASLAYLRSIADDGELSFGTIILPTSYLDGVGYFNHAALDAAGICYVDVPAVEGITENADGSITLRAALVNIKSKNIGMSFSAIQYVTYKVNGVEVVNYGGFYQPKNSRSIRNVAKLALEDVSATATSVYAFLVNEGVYSRYTAAQRAVLTGFYDPATAEKKTIDLYFIAGQSNASGSTAHTDAFVESDPDFVNGYPYVLYSGNSGSGSGTVGLSRQVFSAVPTTARKGRHETYMGPELGIAKALSDYYNETTGKTAGIIKYAVGGTSLLNNLTGSDEPEGNWCPPSYITELGTVQQKTGGLYRNFMATAESMIEDYRALGYDVTVCGIYWMQGEADRNRANTLTLYPHVLELLISDMRRDLGALVGADLSDTPFVVGEISETFGMARTENQTKFVAMQNATAASLRNVYTNHSGVLTTGTDASDTAHWTSDDAYFIGRMVGTKLYAYSHGLEVPANETTGMMIAAVYDSKGVEVGKYASFSYAIAVTPAGGTVKLLDDLTLYAALYINNQGGIVIDGNGYDIDSYAVQHGIRFFDCNVTLRNFNFYHHTEGDDAATYAAYFYKGATGATVTIESGNISSWRYGLVVNQDNCTLNITGGNFEIRHGVNTNSAPVTTTNANTTINISGGTFTANGKGACVALFDSDKGNCTATITGGTFNGSSAAVAAIYNGEATFTLYVDTDNVTVTGGSTYRIQNAGNGTITQ